MVSVPHVAENTGHSLEDFVGQDENFVPKWLTQQGLQKSIDVLKDIFFIFCIPFIFLIQIAFIKFLHANCGHLDGSENDVASFGSSRNLSSPTKGTIA